LPAPLRIDSLRCAISVHLPHDRSVEIDEFACAEMMISPVRSTGLAARVGSAVFFCFFFSEIVSI
jgi:hypothetical protein